MASRKETISDKAVAIVNGDAPIRTSKIPSLFQFPLLVTLSLVLSTLFYTLASDVTAGDLAAVSRELNEWWQVGALVGWRTFELGLGWYGNYDGYDLAALTLLSHGPPLYLLASFYEVRSLTVISSLVIDALTTYLPFRLLRPLSLAHSASSHSESSPIPNSDVITDIQIQAYTTILAALVYSVTIFTAYSTYLPVHLVTYFNNIPTIAAVHETTYVSLVPLTLVLGLAAKSFIFTPAAASAPSLADARNKAFNPATATLSDTIWWNLWGFEVRTRVVIQRTATLMLVTGVNTFVQTWVTIDGVEAVGAVAYSALWVIASAFTGAALGYAVGI